MGLKEKLQCFRMASRIPNNTAHIPEYLEGRGEGALEKWHFATLEVNVCSCDSTYEERADRMRVTLGLG